MENQILTRWLGKLGSSILGKAGTRRCQAFLLDWGSQRNPDLEPLGIVVPIAWINCPSLRLCKEKKEGANERVSIPAFPTGTCTLEQGPQGGAKDEQELSTGRERNCDFQGRDLVYELLEILELQRVMQ